MANISEMLMESTDPVLNMRQITDQLNVLEEKRKHVEHRLTASEVRYRRLFETAQDGILIIDADTEEITDVNPFMSEMLGYTKEHFLGKRLWEIGFFKDIIANKQAFQELQDEGFIRYEDLPLETSDGRPVDVEFVSNVYMVDDDKVIQCNIRDITARKKAENSLIKSKNNMEGKIKKRTASLSRANKQLRLYAAEVIRAHEDERKLVARELHDQIGQSLTSLNIMMNHSGLFSSMASNPSLKEAQTIVIELMQQVRDMALDLRPSMLDDLGLLPTLLWHIKRYTTQTGVKVTFEHNDVNGSVNSDVSIAVYRIVQEALNNIVRHANVDEAYVNVWVDKKAIHLVVKDLGSGFDVAGLRAGTSTGLSGMRERTLSLNGSFNIESSADLGTFLSADIPLSK